jgi:hypothetical protein
MHTERFLINSGERVGVFTAAFLVRIIPGTSLQQGSSQIHKNRSPNGYRLVVVG